MASQSRTWRGAGATTADPSTASSPPRPMASSPAHVQNKDVMIQILLKVIPGRDLWQMLGLQCLSHLWSLGVMGVENMLIIV